MEKNVLSLITKFILDLRNFVDGEIPGVEIYLSDENCKKIRDGIKLYCDGHPQSSLDASKFNNVTMSKDAINITLAIKNEQ